MKNNDHSQFFVKCMLGSVKAATTYLIGCCSSSIEINYHNKCYIMFFKLYVLCLFSITKLVLVVVLFNWPVAQTSNRKLVEKIFLNQRTSTIFGGQVD